MQRTRKLQKVFQRKEKEKLQTLIKLRDRHKEKRNIDIQKERKRG